MSTLCYSFTPTSRQWEATIEPWHMRTDPRFLCLALLDLRLTDIGLLVNFFFFSYGSLKKFLVIAHFSFHFKSKHSIQLPCPQSPWVLHGPLLVCLSQNSVHMKLLKIASIRMCHLFSE